MLHWIANHLPRRLVYFCVIRVWAHATTGKYSSDDATGMLVHEILKRWESSNARPK